MREIDRIVKVYQEYDASLDVRSRRDPSNPGNVCIARERDRGIVRLLERRGLLPLTRKHILDVGCGFGDMIASLRGMGAEASRLYGIDLLPDRIESARRTWPDIDFRCGNAEHLEFPDGYFDLVLLFTVVSSILNTDLVDRVVGEVHRVLKPGGAILWYDMRYNNPENSNIRGVTKGSIRLLFADFQIELHPITLVPVLARRLGPLTSSLYPVLAAIRPLRTHYLGFFTKPLT